MAGSSVIAITKAESIGGLDPGGGGGMERQENFLGTLKRQNYQTNE